MVREAGNSEITGSRLGDITICRRIYRRGKRTAKHERLFSKALALHQKQEEIKKQQHYLLKQLAYEIRCYTTMDEVSSREQSTDCNEMRAGKERRGMIIISAPELCTDTTFVDMFNITNRLYEKMNYGIVSYQQEVWGRLVGS